MFTRVCFLLAALLGASGVGLGAYQAHGLEKWLDSQAVRAEEQAKRLDNCEVAVRYQMYHALALAVLGLAAQFSLQSGLARGCAFLFTSGVACFSGGLYFMVFTGDIGHWAIVPSGGMMLILGWLSLGLAAAIGNRAARAE